MARRAKIKPLIDTTPRISTNQELADNTNYEFALIPTDEFTQTDWNEVVRAISELVDVNIQDFELAGSLATLVDHAALLTEAAEAKGWQAPTKSVLLALETGHKERTGHIESEFRSLSQLNLFNDSPMIMPSLINKDLRHAAVEKAKTYLLTASKPVMTFIENTKPTKHAEHEIMVDSGLATAQGTMPVEYGGVGERDQVTDDTLVQSHVFTSGGTDNENSIGDDTATTLRNEITMLRNDNDQVNHRIMNQEKLIEEITFASEEHQTQLEREVQDKTRQLQELVKEKRHENTMHAVQLDQLESEIERLKTENAGLNDLFRKVRGHESKVDRFHEQFHEAQSRGPSVVSEKLQNRQTAQVGDFHFSTGEDQNKTFTEQMYISPSTLSTISPLDNEQPLTGREIDNLPTAPPRRLLIDHNTRKLRTDDLPIGTHINPNVPKPSAMEFQLPRLQGTETTPLTMFPTLRPPAQPNATADPKPGFSLRQIPDTQTRDRGMTTKQMPLTSTGRQNPVGTGRPNPPLVEQRAKLTSLQRQVQTSPYSRLPKRTDMQLFVNDNPVQAPTKLPQSKSVAKLETPGTRIDRTSTRALNRMDGLDDDDDQDHNLKGYGRRFRIFQPKDFGLSTWKPADMDINTHLDIVAKCVEEARSMGATEANLIRLLMRTMPDNYKFLNEFITCERRVNYETFASEVARVLSERAPVQMATFLSASRKPGEHLLSYFYRIATLYKSSNGLIGDSWQDDSTHVIALLAKVYESLYESAKSELTRRLEPHIEQNNLTIDILKNHLVEVSKLGSTRQKFAAEKLSITALDKVETNNEDNQFKEEESDGKESGPGCWDCNSPGHFRADCVLWRRSIGQRGQRERKNPRDGRPGSAYQSGRDDAQ